jgi:hypothetical protein
MPPSRIVELMKTGAASVEIALAGASAFVELTGGRGTWSERLAALEAKNMNYRDNCRVCMESGCLAALVQVMIGHAGVSEVCEMASMALRNISANSADHCAGAGAVPVLVAALTTHGAVAGVCASAASAIEGIVNGYGFNPGRQRDLLVSAGAVPALIAALDYHKDDALVCSPVALSLGSIAQGGSVSRKVVCVNAGAIPALVAILKAHAADAGACENAAGALSHVVQSGDLQTILSLGAAPLLAAVCRTHKGEARRVASGTLAKWGFNENGTKREDCVVV